MNNEGSAAPHGRHEPGRASAGGSMLASRIRPLTPPTLTFGRVVEGVDLSESSLRANPQLRNEIVDAVYEHGLLVFRDQGHLTPADEVAFARLFTHQPDDLSANVSYTGGAGTQHRLPDYPCVALVGSYSVTDYHGLTASSPGVYGDWDADQRAWHCDGLADTHPPPDLTTMRCLKATSRGGETLFASSVRAAELLPVDSLVRKYGIHPEDANVNYKLFANYKIAMEGTHLEQAEGSKGDDTNLAEGTTVPLVIRERRTGKRSMVGTYHIAGLVNAACSDVEGNDNAQISPPKRAMKSLDFGDANAYLAEAWRPGLSDENVYRHRWRVGDLAAWTNRLVIHTATSTRAYAGEERLHTRIRMRSREEDAPIAWKIE